MNKEEKDKRIKELFSKIKEETPVARTLEEALKREGFAVHSSVEEALEAKRKNREEQRKRIEARQRVKKNDSDS